MSILKRLVNFLVLSICFWSFSGQAQSYHLSEGRSSQKINFQLVNNLIIIPIEVNGTILG